MSLPLIKRKKSEKPTLEQLRGELKHIQYRQRYYRTLATTAFTLVVVAAVTVLIAMLWLPILEMYGTSMEPTLKEGDIVVSVATKEVQRGEIIAFYYGNKLLVKRCIALPGETVSIDEDGNVYVNGIYIDEPYVQQKAVGDCDIEFPFEVPLEQYFVLGDHRETSLDSRNSVVGCVSYDQLCGRVVWRIWPLRDAGAVKS